MSDEYVVCQICGEAFSYIHGKHLKSRYCLLAQQLLNIHVPDIQSYRAMFPEAFTCSKKHSDLMKYTAKQTWDSYSPSEKEMRLSKSSLALIPVEERDWWNDAAKNDKRRQELKKRWAGLSSEERSEIAIKIVKTREERHDWSVVTKESNAKVKEMYGGPWGKIGRDEWIRKIKVGVNSWWEGLTPMEKMETLNGGIYKAFRHPNISESRLILILEPLGFKYAGGFKVAGHLPDFVHLIYPLIIEFDGWLGHDLRSPYTTEEQPERDNQRDVDYRAAGYEVLRLLSCDLEKGMEFIQQKVVGWMNGLGYTLVCKVIDDVAKERWAIPAGLDRARGGVE